MATMKVNSSHNSLVQMFVRRHRRLHNRLQRRLGWACRRTMAKWKPRSMIISFFKVCCTVDNIHNINSMIDMFTSKWFVLCQWHWSRVAIHGLITTKDAPEDCLQAVLFDVSLIHQSLYVQFRSLLELSWSPGVRRSQASNPPAFVWGHLQRCLLQNHLETTKSCH